MLGHVTVAKASVLGVFCTTGLLMAALAGTVQADEAASLAGKQISVIIGASPGGGTDGTSRLVARFMQDYLPGKPRMIYRNMPAGNGTQATNYFANDAARDGTAWMAGDNSYISASALRDPSSKYDPRVFNFIGGIIRGGNIMIMAKDKLPVLTDKSKPPVIIGTPTNMNTGAEMVAWGAEALGWNIRFVIGYSGTPGMVLALRRGEIDMFMTSNLSILQPLEETGKFVPAVQMGQLENGQVVERTNYPKTPIFPNMVQGKLTGLTAEAFDFWLKSDQIDKWFALPPKVPTSMVQAYIAAYDKAVAHPEFIKAGKLQFSDDFSLQNPGDIAEIVKGRSYPRSEILNEIRRVKEAHGLPAEPINDQDLAKMSASLGKMHEIKSDLTTVENGGRLVSFKAGSEVHKVDVSDGRTEVTIGGKKEKRDSLKPGMTCRIVYPDPGAEAQIIECN